MYDRRALMATPHGLPCSPQPTAPARPRLPAAGRVPFRRLLRRRRPRRPGLGRRLLQDPHGAQPPDRAPPVQL